MHTVKVDTNFVREAKDDFNRPILAHKIECSCGWDTTAKAYACESTAKRHILYTHGGGYLEYADTSTFIGKTPDEDAPPANITPEDVKAWNETRPDDETLEIRNVFDKE